MVEARPFVDGYGVEVFARWWPAAEPVGLMLVSHGASEHGGRYDRFATALNAAGFAVAALDHRGHGETAASTGGGVTGPGGGAALIDDLHQLRAEAAGRVGQVPVFVFGHSMGALIALTYLVGHSNGLAGGVLCGMPVNVDETSELAAGLQAAGDAGLRDQPMTVLTDANAAFEPARTPYDWLSRDPDEVDRYVADPMCGDGNPLTYGYLIDLFEVAAPARHDLDAVGCPVLVIAGDQDPAAAMGANARVLADALRSTGADVELTVYEGARHELLNETNRDDVTADVVAWLRAHVAP